ncbi:MAG: hypothetical protein ACRCWO_11170 [Bosea sp. (in: a-proteobacteria)]
MATAEIAADLEKRGFFQADSEVERHWLFIRGQDFIFIRMPNTSGNIPEIHINNAYEAAGLVPPKWNVFWCD